MAKSSQESRRTRALIEAGRDPMVIIDREGKICELNETVVSATGLSRKNLLGSYFAEHFTDPQKANELYGKVFANKPVLEPQLTLLGKKGKSTDVLFSGSVYHNDLGEAYGILVVTKDIAEKKCEKELRVANKALALQFKEKEKRVSELAIVNKELAILNLVKEKCAAELIIANKELAFQNDEKNKRAAELVIADSEIEIQNKEKEKLKDAGKVLEARRIETKLASEYTRSLIEASLDPLFTISLAGKITDVNAASVNVTGISREKLIGTDFLIYFTEPEKAKKAYLKVYEDGFVTDYPLTIKDHVFTDVLLNGSVYKDEEGKVIGIVVVGRDITEQKRVATELTDAIVAAESATQLAEEAKVNAEKATTTAENAVRAKQQFLSNMSHEIRTPMNAIIGFTKVLLKTELSAKQKEYLTAIKLSGDALIVLINDILDLAKVEAGKMSFEKIPFRLSASISAMIHIFEAKIQEKNLVLLKEFDPRIPEVLLGDPLRLHQIILNLVSNAVKFTQKGYITVSVSLLEEDDEQVTVEFSVTDTGIGIPEEKLKNIFANFQQASSDTARLYGGTGLGLAIVKHLVEPQGGTMQVTSKVGEGSTFSFILNFQKTNEVAEMPIDIEEFDADFKNIRVLVVEDMALNQLLMKTLLDDFGFERDIAANGRIALEMLETGTYDIILMDLQMPELNGFEATEYIRNTMKLDIPIIALTADVTTVDLAKCTSVGMNDYIAKPVDERLLYRKIISLVGKHIMRVIAQDEDPPPPGSNLPCINLGYMDHRTKSDPELMMEMISLYLDQTPPLILAMKESWEDKDWTKLHSAIHKMIPSFSIVGIHVDFENMAKQVQDYATSQLNRADGIDELVLQLETVCNQACIELQHEFNRIKNAQP